MADRCFPTYFGGYGDSRQSAVVSRQSQSSVRVGSPSRQSVSAVPVGCSSSATRANESTTPANENTVLSVFRIIMRDDLKAAFRSLESSKTFTAVALARPDARHRRQHGDLLGGRRRRPARTAVRRARPPRRGRRAPPAGIDPDPNRDPHSISSIAPQNYIDWAAQQQVFESIAAIAGGAVTLREPGAEPEDLALAAGHRRTSSTCFAFSPAIGRALHGRRGSRRTSPGRRAQRWAVAPALRRRSRPSSDARFRSRAAPTKSSGVMPPDFAYPVGALRPTDLWIPYVVPPDERIAGSAGSRSIYLQSIARLKPGVSVQQAQAQMDADRRGARDRASGVEQGLT